LCTWQVNNVASRVAIAYPFTANFNAFVVSDPDAEYYAAPDPGTRASRS
jgi:hypothetical protein